MCLLVGQGSSIGALLYFKFLASKALHCTLYHVEQLVSQFQHFSDHIETYSPGTVVNFRRSGGFVVLAKILGPVVLTTSLSHMSPASEKEQSEKDSDSASDTEIVWAKSVRGVWGLANNYANEKWSFTRDVPEVDCLPQGLEPPVKPAAKHALKAAKPRVRPSTKSAAKPAAGEPIRVAPIEHVQLFKVKYSRQKKWHTEPVSE